MTVHRVYLLGDSITQGLGSKKVNFSGELARLLGPEYEVVNLALTGTTIGHALDLLEDGKVCASPSESVVCVILYGNVDAQIRPNSKGRVFPHIPRRYKGGGMLMPRPFYSHTLRKSLGQHLDNAVRRILSKLIVAVDGTEQWVPLDAFCMQYERLLANLAAAGISSVACSCVYIDGRLFPDTPRQYAMYNEQISEIASAFGVPYLDLWSPFKNCVAARGWDSVYNKDHFHPNGDGYQTMAELIAGSVRDSLAKQLDFEG